MNTSSTGLSVREAEKKYKIDEPYHFPGFLPGHPSRSQSRRGMRAEQGSLSELGRHRSDFEDVEFEMGGWDEYWRDKSYTEGKKKTPSSLLKGKLGVLC